MQFNGSRTYPTRVNLTGRSDNYIYRLSELKCTSRSSLPHTSVEYGLSSSAFSWKQGNILAVAGRNGEIVILDTKSSTNKEELLPHCCWFFFSFFTFQIKVDFVFYSHVVFFFSAQYGRYCGWEINKFYRVE